MAVEETVESAADAEKWRLQKVEVDKARDWLHSHEGQKAMTDECTRLNDQVLKPLFEALAGPDEEIMTAETLQPIWLNVCAAIVVGGTLLSNPPPCIPSGIVASLAKALMMGMIDDIKAGSPAVTTLTNAFKDKQQKH